MPLLSALKDFAQTTPQAPFLLEDNKILTYGETLQIVTLVASGLAKEGVKPGDRVILALPNGFDFCVALYGIQWAGATAILVNPRYTTFEYQNVFTLTEPKLVIGDKGNKNLAESLKTLKLIGAGELAQNGASSFERQKSPTGIAAMLLTSGTTGKSKAVMLSPEAIYANAVQLSERKKVTPSDRFLCSIPLFHSTGHTAVLQSVLASGASMAILNGFTPETFLEATHRYECTAISGVPTLYQHLLNHFANKPTDLSKLRICVSGGAPMPVSLFEDVEKKFKAFLLEGYGLTEVSAGACGNPLDRRKVGTVGLPLPNTELKIADDNGQQIIRGETGEILIRGPQLMDGYFRDPEATAQAITKDGWLRSGDLGIQDKDGYVTIRSRKKELIIRSGFNVYPAEVENALRSIEGVQDVTVVGLPDPLYGETIHAALISDLNVDQLTSLLRENAKSKLAGYKRPTTFSLHKDFPRTGSSKVQKSAMVDRLKDEPSLVFPL